MNYLRFAAIFKALVSQSTLLKFFLCWILKGRKKTLSWWSWNLIFYNYQAIRNETHNNHRITWKFPLCYFLVLIQRSYKERMKTFLLNEFASVVLKNLNQKHIFVEFCLHVGSIVKKFKLFCQLRIIFKILALSTFTVSNSNYYLILAYNWLSFYWSPKEENSLKYFKISN